MVVFIKGFFVQELQQMYQKSLKLYFLSAFNIMNLTMSVLYMCSYGLKYFTTIYVAIKRMEIEQPEFWLEVSNLSVNNLLSQKKVYDTFYWLNAGMNNFNQKKIISIHNLKLLFTDRFYWVSYDPINLAEGLFAFANIFSFSRIIFLLPVNENVGPLQITLMKMIIVRFILFFIYLNKNILFILDGRKIHFHFYNYILSISVFIKQYLLVL